MMENSNSDCLSPTFVKLVVMPVRSVFFVVEIAVRELVDFVVTQSASAPFPAENFVFHLCLCALLLEFAMINSMIKTRYSIPPKYLTEQDRINKVY